MKHLCIEDKIVLNLKKVEISLTKCAGRDVLYLKVSLYMCALTTFKCLASSELSPSFW